MNDNHTTTSVGSRQVQFNQKREREQHCRDSIYALGRELNRNPECIESLQGWIASYHALSVIYQQQEQIDLALQCLTIPHCSVLHMAKCTNGSAEQRLIAKSAMKLTLPPLLDFSRRYPPCDNCVRDLEQQRRALENDDTIYH